MTVNIICFNLISQFYLVKNCYISILEWTAVEEEMKRGNSSKVVVYQEEEPNPKLKGIKMHLPTLKYKNVFLKKK